MKTNHDGTVTLNAYNTWTSCLACGKRVTGDSIHTCSPQLKTLTDAEFDNIFANGKRLGVLETEDRFRRAMALTDGEIVKIFQTTGFWQYSDLVHETDAIEFAKAILKKASEG